MQHVFIVGAKGFVYGGYESFLDKLTEYHQNNKNIQYHIACKANGIGKTDESKLKGIEVISETEYRYHNAHCFKIKSLDLGAAQAVLYDLKALQYCCKYIQKHNIKHPVVYVLSSRVGFMMGHFARKIHKLGGKYLDNPDGLEFKRTKYPKPVRAYWKWSEKLMVKHSDLVVCDSLNIEKYIQKEYEIFHPKTTYIAYGSDITPSMLPDDDPKYVSWLEKFGLSANNYYVSVGRFVPENNFEVMIREFMRSNTKKDFVIITTEDKRYAASLQKKLKYESDKRIKFVGTVYDGELLRKIRENAYGYLHGHEVGGTNPSLLESLGSTDLNLLYDVGFNREVAADAALYWSKEDGDLAGVIDKADKLKPDEIREMGSNAKQRIIDSYSWKFICNRYEKLFLDLK